MRRLTGRLRNGARCSLPFVLLLGTAGTASAAWELGLRAGGDSNVTRAVRDGTSAAFVEGVLGYNREGSGESRLDWTLAAALEGAVYTTETDLDYGAFSVSPGISYVAFAGWTLSAAPFFQGKLSKDDRQSALALGVRVALQQQFGAAFFLTEHYSYTDSKADEEVFSYREHALGVTAGYSWTPRFATEVGYQYSYGDSFRTLGAPAGGPGSGGAGPGGGERGSAQASGGRRGVEGFGGEVVKDKVVTHQLSATLVYRWTEVFSNAVGYTVSVGDGDEGTSTSHVGYLGASYRF